MNTQWHWMIYYSAWNNDAMPTYIWTGKHAVIILSAYSLAARYAVDVQLSQICTTRIAVQWPLPYVSNGPFMLSSHFHTYHNVCSSLSLVYSMFAKELVHWRWTTTAMARHTLTFMSGSAHYCMTVSQLWLAFVENLRVKEDIISLRLIYSTLRSTTAKESYDLCIRQDDYPVCCSRDEPTVSKYKKSMEG